jgi:hypothetical protein
MKKFVLFKGKKAFIFNITLVVLSIIILTYGYIRLSEKTEVEKEIGENSLEIITRLQEGEKALIFLDFAAKMAIYQAIYDLQQQGGISETGACGTYYGFNRWNGESGQECFVDADRAKDSLRDLFVSSLVARVAAYPSADFIGNVPTAAFARGMALASTERMGVSANAPAEEEATACSGGQDFMQDFTFNGDSAFFPTDGSRVWVHSQATCPGSYPLIIFLHGCMRASHASVHKDFGDSSSTDIIPLTKRLIEAGKSMPVILAAHSQTSGEAVYDGVPGSACGESLWGRDFDASGFVDAVESRLPAGVSVSSVSFIGHSEAGCSINTGIHKALSEVRGVFAIGQFDTCSNRVLGSSMDSRLSESTSFLAIYSSMGVHRSEQNSAMGISGQMRCPVSEITGGELSECLVNASSSRFAFTMRDISGGSHGTALLVGVEQFLGKFFPSGSAFVSSEDESESSGSPEALNSEAGTAHGGEE